MAIKNPNRQPTPHPASGSPHPSLRATLSHPMGEGHLPSAEKGGGLRGALSLPAADVMLEKAELAVKLKVHVRTIENWQRDGFLPYIKIGNAVWFYWPDVIQHLLANFRVLAPLATEKISSTPHPGATGEFVRRTSSGLRPPSPQRGEGNLPDRGGEGMKSWRAQ